MSDQVAVEENPVAERWFEDFKSHVLSFYTHLEDLEKKNESANKVCEMFSTWKEDFYSKFDEPRNSEKVHFTIAIAHFCVLNDDIFPYDERPMRAIIDTLVQEGLVLWFNTLDKIDQEISVVIGSWMNKVYSEGLPSVTPPAL